MSSWQLLKLTYSHASGQSWEWFFLIRLFETERSILNAWCTLLCLLRPKDMEEGNFAFYLLDLILADKFNLFCYCAIPFSNIRNHFWRFQKRQKPRNFVVFLEASSTWVGMLRLPVMFIEQFLYSRPFKFEIAIIELLISFC